MINVREAQIPSRIVSREMLEGRLRGVSWSVVRGRREGRRGEKRRYEMKEIQGKGGEESGREARGGGRDTEDKEKKGKERNRNVVEWEKLREGRGKCKAG